MAPPNTIGIASTLAGSCISHISKVSGSRRKHKDDNYRIALHREFGRFRLWLHGFREPVTGQTFDQRSPDNALDEVLEEATYLKEPTTLLLLTFTSCLLSEHLKNVGDDLTRASLKASLYQAMKIYPHMKQALEHQWNTRESVITEISDTINLLFDLAPPLDDVLETIRYRLAISNGTTEQQGEVLETSSELMEEDLPELTIPLADAYCIIYQKYIQDKFPNASPDLDIDRFAKGNVRCHDKLVAESEMPMPSESAIYIVAPASSEVLDDTSKIDQPVESQGAITFHDSGLGSSAPTQTIISPSMGESPSIRESTSMGESPGRKMPMEMIVQDYSLESSVPRLPDTASAQMDLKGTFPAPAPSISGLSQSTLCSQSSTPDKRPSLPAIPQNPPYYCKLCRSNLKQMSKKSRGHQWRKHIFCDLEAYMCIRANCSQTDTFFKTKSEWVAHDMTCNQDLPHGSKGSQPPLTAQCPFCVKEFGANKRGFYSHVAHHMEDIRLFALPASYRDLTDDFQNSSNTGASTSGSHVDRDGLPTIAEISDSQPYDESKLESYLKANTKADKSFISDWVLGGSPLHAEGQPVLASGEIQRPIDGSLRMSELIYTSVENDRWLKILAWLSTVEYENHHILSQRRRQEGTGAWLFEDKTFVKWRDSEANSVLWIRGIPGSGKTILASSIVDRFRSLPASNDGNAVACFYCSYKEPDRSDAGSILRTLLKQLCINKGDREIPTLVNQFYQMREEEGDENRPLNPEEGTELIIALSEKYQSTTIIIDALDECDEGTRKSLFSSLHKIVQNATRVNVTVTSRYDVDINGSISTVSGLCYYIDNGDNSGDINLYIDAELDRRCHPSNIPCDYDLLLEGKIDPELKALIRSRLQVESKGMFLWVNLQIKALCAARTAGDVKEVLDRMPLALSETYSQILERIQLQDSCRVAVVILKWLLCAQKPCTTGRIIQALAIDPGVPDLNNEGLNREIPDILRICKGLVVHDEELGIFRFAHPSVQEFLVQEHAFERESSNKYVAEVCVTALLYHHGDGSSIPELYSYAMEYWGDHARISGVTTGTLPILCMDFFKSSVAYNQWGTKITRKIDSLKPALGESTPVVGPLLVVSYYGLSDLCRLIIEDSRDQLHLRNEAGKTSLSTAADKGHDRVVLVLLEFGSDVSSKDNAGKTALSTAAESGHEKVVKLLLERDDVDVNSKDSEHGRTPLSWAAGSGHDEVVKLLLEMSGVDADSRCQSGRTPLSWAAESGHEKVVQLLLEREDVDVNLKVHGQTLLSWAAERGHEKVVQLLLEREDLAVSSKGATNSQSSLLRAAKYGRDMVVKLLLEREDVDVNFKVHGRTPLSWAAERGHEKVVKLLLEKMDVDVNSKDSTHGRTPLSWAAGIGHVKVLKLLLEREDVDLNSKDSTFSKSPLSWAAENGHDKVVQLLLEREDVDVNLKDSTHGRTPLFWAVEKGHDKMVKLLLEREDVDVNSKDSTHGQSPLSWAMERGDDEVVQLLLEREDVDVNSKDITHGRTPLSWAAENGRDKNVKLLLGREDVDVDPKDSTHGRTPLSWAAGRGDDEVVQLLLERNGVDANSIDKTDRTPLSWAAGRGHATVVKLLLGREDVDVDPKDSTHGRTPLSWAAGRGDDEVVQLLLERNGVDANSIDKTDRTPLSWAAGRGHATVVKLLLEREDVDLDLKDSMHGRTPLSWAAERGDDEVVQLLLERNGVDANSMDKTDRTPLSWAAEKDHPKIVKLLLGREDVDVDPKDSTRGRTPLSWAAGRGDDEVVQLLLERNGVDANSMDKTDRTPLSWAAENGHDKVVQLLLEREDVDVNLKDSTHGRTPLFWAVEKGHDKMVKLLLEREDVDVNSKDSTYGQSPLSWAAGRTLKWWKNDMIVELLLERNGVDADSKSKTDRTPLSWAAEHGNDEAVKLLLEREDVDVNSKDSTHGRTPLSWAVESGHEKAVKLLLEKEDVDVNSKDSTHGRTLLSWAAERGHEKVVKLLLEKVDVDVNSKDSTHGRTPLSWAAGIGHVKVLKLLLEREDVDLNSKDSTFSKSPLSWAAENGHDKVVQLLLEREDVDVNLKVHGQTLLSWAAERGHEKVVRLLLEKKDVDVNSKDSTHGRTPLSWAAGRGDEEVVQVLLEREDVDVNSKDSTHGRTPLSWAAGRTVYWWEDDKIVKLLLEKNGADADSKSKTDRTPLSWAAEHYNYQAVKLLLEREDVDVNSKDSTHGRTPLSWAAERGRDKIVKLLLEKEDVDVNSRDSTHGRTPLSWATAKGHDVTVKLLLEREDVDVNSRDVDGKTPLDLAAQRDRRKVIQILRNHMGTN